MPPKVKITKEDVLSSGLAVVRAEGIEALNARSVAKRLGCSTQPIFSNYASMEELRADVLARADSIYQAAVSEAMKNADYPYKASGSAYIRFAREEKHLFRLLFMRDRSGEPVTEDRVSIAPMLKLIEASTGLSEDDAFRFHMEMWIFVHGIAVMEATAYMDWDPALIDEELSEVFLAMRERHREKAAEKREETQ